MYYKGAAKSKLGFKNSGRYTVLNGTEFDILGIGMVSE